MKRTILFFMVIGLFLGVTFLSACSNNTTTNTGAATSETQMTSTTSYTHWWEQFGQPQYGGQMVIAAFGTLDNVTFGPDATGKETQLWEESLFVPDWHTDRQEWSFQQYYIPADRIAGLLSESWEQNDPLTVTVHLRHGIHWWDRPPVNGHELTASDVAYNYKRLLDSSGSLNEIPTAPEPGSMPAPINFIDIESVVAKDAYTVVFKMKKTSEQILSEVFSGLNISPPELLKIADETTESTAVKNGSTNSSTAESSDMVTGPDFSLNDAIGTGPWIPVTYYHYSSVVYERNPDYWGFDEHYPQNRLPYIDTIKYIAIWNEYNLESALRTGKIDIEPDSRALIWQRAKKLLDTNLTMNIAWIQSSGYDLEMRVDSYPFNDIKVRKALNMAIDRQGIAKSMYGDAASGTPCGLISPVYTGYAFAYSQWPDELKEVYSFNPNRARRLLTEAGLPHLQTNCMVSQEESLELLHILQYEFKEIGVTLKIRQADATRYRYLIMSGVHDQLCLDRRTGMVDSPYSILAGRLTTAASNYTRHNDIEYDELVDRLKLAETVGEAKQFAAAADRYALEQCWTINICPMASPIIWQPYLKGYSGESLTPYYGYYYARWWIDGGLKQSLER